MQTFVCPHCNNSVRINDEGKVINQHILCQRNNHHLKYAFQAKLQVMRERIEGKLIAA